MKVRKYCGKARVRVRSEFLAYPLIPESRFYNRYLAIPFCCESRCSGGTQFFDPLTVTVRSNPSSVTDSVPIISELDCDTFILVGVEVPNFQVRVWFSLEICSLTSLPYFLFHT